MRFLVFLSFYVSATAAFAVQSEVKEANILEISLRTLEYTSSRYADMAIVRIDKDFTSNAEGCSSRAGYLLANHDKAIYSALLAAKLSNKKLDFYIDKDLPKVDSYCKLVAVIIK